MCHFKKGTEICNYSYPSPILSVKLNRSRLIICLSTSIYIHGIRDMKLLHSIRHIAPNILGLCTLSLHSHLAFPISAHTGELQIYDAANLKAKHKIHAHESPLAAIDFSSNGMLVATASEKGTVIRVFCVKNGQKVHEFRRGVKRYVRIASLNFSNCGNYVCVSSNTETVHIFKIDQKAVEIAERQICTSTTAQQQQQQNEHHSDDSLDGDRIDNTTTTDNIDENHQSNNDDQSHWTMGFITKAMTSCFPGNVVSDVLCQDRAFATVQLSQAGLRYDCVIAKLKKETKLIAACEDGFLYIYNFDDAKGGECKLLRAHDLRNALCGVTGNFYYKNFFAGLNCSLGRGGGNCCWLEEPPSTNIKHCRRSPGIWRKINNWKDVKIRLTPNIFYRGN